MELGLRKAGSASGYSRFVTAYVLILALALVALCSYSVSGIRGTDQYWYITDTETLMRDSPPVTNFRFPGMLLREDSSNPITYFVHNGPVLHINKYLGNLLNISATNAWELSNIIWWVGGAIVLIVLLRSVVPLNVAVLGGLFYFVTPIVAWQAANFLQEIWLGFLAAVFFYYSYRLKTAQKTNWLLLPFIVIGSASHPFFVLCSIYLMVAAIFYRKHYIFILAIIVTLLIVLLFKDNVFPSSFPPDLPSIVSSTIPGKTNLHWQFDDNPVPVSVELIRSKLTEALKVQFFKPSIAPMTVVGNIGMLALLLLLVLRRGRLNRVICFTLFSLGAWWGMVVLLQNQARYQLLILPALIACIVLLFDRLFRQKTTVKLLVFCTVCFFLADIYLFSRVRSDTAREHQARSSVTEALASLPPDASYAVVDQNRGLLKLIISQLAPAQGLMVDPRYIQKENLARSLSLFQPDYLVTSMEKIPDVFSPVSSRRLTDSTGDFQLIVYQLGSQ